MDTTEEATPAPPELCLWLDHETDGLDVQTVRVLEIAWWITDTDLKQILPHRSHVIRHDPGWDANLDPFVREMHTANGLLAEVATADTTLFQAQQFLHHDIREALILTGQPRGKVTLTGAGVNNYDLPLIRRTMPFVANYLNYYCYDISVFRRIWTKMMKASPPVSWAPEEAPNGLVAHRAFDDILHAMHEYRLYRDHLGVLDKAFWAGIEG